jgi:hypothetical protein
MKQLSGENAQTASEDNFFEETSEDISIPPKEMIYKTQN